MRYPFLPGLAALGLLLAPGQARAQWSARLALEAPLCAGYSTTGTVHSGFFTIGESFQPSLDVIGSYFVADTLSVDLEFRRGLAATGTGFSRPLTYLGPGVTLDVPTFPLYGRLSVPIQIEEAAAVFFRLGGGLKILDLAFIRVYFELTTDVPLGGSGVKFFSGFSFNAGLGLWLKL